MWRTLKDICRTSIIGDPNESRLELNIRTMSGGQSLIILYGWEAVQERGKGVGVSNNFLVLDEVSKYVNFDYGWEEILRPTLMDTKGGALFISTTNGFNHFYELCNREINPKYNQYGEWKSFHFTSYDNPHLSSQEIEMMKDTMTEDRAAQEIYAEFRKKEGLVYKEFSRAQHVINNDERPEVIQEKLGGVDAGYTHPTAVLTIIKDYEGIYWVMDEWVETGKNEAEIVEYTAAQRFSKVYPDPENASLVASLSKRCNVRSVNKGKGSIVSGIQVVRELLKQNRLKIHPSCLKLIQAFEMYSYKESKGSATPDELPAHDFSDPLDALRYVLMMDANSTASQGPKIHLSQNKHYGQIHSIPRFNA